MNGSFGFKLTYSCYVLQLYPEEDYLTGDQLMWEFNETVGQWI